MAASNPPGHGRPDEEATDRRLALPDTLAPASARQTVRAFAFWSAVVLPFLHVPLLATGLDAPGEQQAFLALLALNALAVLAGHRHRP